MAKVRTARHNRALSHGRSGERCVNISLVLLISLLCLLKLTYCLGQASTQPRPKPPPPSPPPRVPPVKSTNNGLNPSANLQPLLKVSLGANSAPKGGGGGDGGGGSDSGGATQIAAPKREQGATGQGRAPLAAQLGQEEPITVLDYSSINDEVLRKQTANFIYFNANFNQCRHCGRFFSTWKELALDIRWWRQVIRLFTINCSDEDNIEVCRRAGVTQFPQVKFYWVMSNSLDQDGQRLRILGKSVHAMRHMIMDRVLDSYTEHQKLLAQRAKQHASTPAVSNPLATLAAAATGAGSGTSTGPLAALMPLVSRLISSSKSASGASTSSSGAAGSPAPLGGGLSGLISLLTGGSSGNPPGSSADSGLGSLMSLVQNLGGFQGIINALTGVASWRRSLTIRPLPSNWPELEAIEARDSQRLLDLLPLNPKKGIGALLIMETQEFLYTGLEVLLDLNTYSNQTYIARVRDERSLLSKNLTKRDDVRAPALIYITEMREPKLIITAPKYTNDEDLRRTFVRAYERRLVKYSVKRAWSQGLAAGGQLALIRDADSSEDEEILNRINDVYMNDLLNTIRASLTDQVYRHPDLSDDQYNALVKYVYALINYFPFKDDNRLKFFKRLHAWLQNQVSPIDMGEYKKQFHDVDEVLGKRSAWYACKSLSSVNSIPADSRRSGRLFDNPAQLGKMVSNITRLFRSNQQKMGQLKDLVAMLTARSTAPVLLSNLSSASGNKSLNRLQLTSTSTTRRPGGAGSNDGNNGNNNNNNNNNNKGSTSDSISSSVEKLIKGVTNGSLGSDSSILKLISTALTGGDPASAGAGGKSGGVKSKFAREYPCGAWKLAHVMVVNEYLLDSPRKDVKHIVLHSLYQYMAHFYACTTCGNRVSDVSGEFRINLDEHLVHQDDSVMLLWKFHNRVNKRLESELRPGSPVKQQFPSELQCPKCRLAKQQGDFVSTPNWSEKNVFGFLLHHYRPQNIIAFMDSSSSDSGASSGAACGPRLSGVLSIFGLDFAANAPPPLALVSLYLSLFVLARC